ncbi:MAG: alanine racemase [Eubacteriales bacterium]|nr:alanine racemase [Eubacteriales bacterium]
MLIRPTYAKIDLNAIKQNVINIKRHIPKNTMFCAVVKADGYGHGSVMVSKAAIEAGAEWLAVAIPEEAAPLRDAGISVPILVLGPSTLWQWRKAAELELSMVVVSEDCIDNAAAVAKEQNIPMRLHLKADTGMNRVGVKTYDETERILDRIENEENLILEGLMTHFAAADEADKRYTRMQNDRFSEYINRVKNRGFSPIIHASSSGAALDCADLSYDMVRVGIAMYGCYPSDEVDKSVALCPAMSVHTHISHIKKIGAGEKISYGGIYTTPKPMSVATLPIGYADGYNRLLSNSGEVLIRGKRARVLGRVCMDQILVDVTDIPDAVLHDDAVCIGAQGGDEISADEYAARCSTINYEILCAISPRVPRLYLEGPCQKKQ